MHEKQCPRPRCDTCRGFCEAIAMELTEAGLQHLIPSVDAITTKARLEVEARRAMGPKRGYVQQKPPGGLFDEDERSQLDWIRDTR